MVIRPDMVSLRLAQPQPAGLREDVHALDKWVQAPNRFGFHEPPAVADVARELRSRGPEEETLRGAAHLAYTFQAHGQSPEPFVQIVHDWQSEGLIAGPADLTQRILQERVPVEGTSVSTPAAPEFSPLAQQFIPAKVGYFLDGQDEAKAYAKLAKDDPQTASRIFPALLHQSGLARGEAAGRLLVPALFEQASTSPELKKVLEQHVDLMLTVIPEAQARGCLGRPKVESQNTVVSNSLGYSGLFRGLATLTPLTVEFVDSQVKPFLQGPDRDWRLGGFSFLTQQLPKHPELAEHAVELALPFSETDDEHQLILEAANQGWRPDAGQKQLLFSRLEDKESGSFHRTARLLGKLCGEHPDLLDPSERRRVAETVLARQELASSLCDPDPPSASCVHALKAFTPELRELAEARIQTLEPAQLLQDANTLALTSFVQLDLGDIAHKLRPLLVSGESEPGAARVAVGRMRDRLLSEGGTPRELMLLNLGRAATHVSPREKQREMAIHERILELAGELPVGPVPEKPLKELSAVELADLALNPPDPDALADQLADYSQPDRMQIACAGLQRVALERGLVRLLSDAPPPERLKAFRQAVVAVNQGGLGRFEELQEAWLSGFPDLTSWGDSKLSVAAELAGCSPDRDSLDRHHSRLLRLQGPDTEQALSDYRQLRDMARDLDGATDRMAELRERFGEEARAMSAFIEDRPRPEDDFRRYAELTGTLADRALVESSFRRGHSEHLEHLTAATRDRETALKTWTAILPRLEAGERYEDIYLSELGVTLGKARQDSSSIALGDKNITIGGVRLPTRKRG